jgi:hypothetical protein
MGAGLEPQPDTAATAAPTTEEETPGPKKPKPGEVKVPARPGLNRFTWDLRTAPPDAFAGMVLWAGGEGELLGPVVPPGAYQVRLTAGAETRVEPVEIRADPRSSASPADLRAQFEFLSAVRDTLGSAHRTIVRVRSARKDLDSLRARLPEGDAAKPLRERIEGVEKTMRAAEEALYQTQNKSPQDPLNFPIRLNDKLALLAGSVGYGDFAPTAQALAVRDELVGKIETELRGLDAIWNTEIPEINRLARELAIPAVELDAPEEPDAATD